MAGISNWEYRRDARGSLTSFCRCWIDGGRDRRCVFLARPDLGFVARALFSCSRRANSNAVDCDKNISMAGFWANDKTNLVIPPTSSVPSVRGSCSSDLSNFSQSTPPVFSEDDDDDSYPSCEAPASLTTDCDVDCISSVAKASSAALASGVGVGDVWLATSITDAWSSFISNGVAGFPDSVKMLSEREYRSDKGTVTIESVVTGEISSSA